MLKTYLKGGISIGINYTAGDNITSSDNRHLGVRESPIYHFTKCQIWRANTKVTIWCWKWTTQNNKNKYKTRAWRHWSRACAGLQGYCFKES